MDLPKIFINIELKKAKIAMAGTLAIVAVLEFSTTDIGARAFAQLGIQDGLVQTVAAAERGLQQTGNALTSFIGRSPGERGTTDILKGKARRVGLGKDTRPNTAKPAQKALGKIFDKPVVGAPESAIPQVAALALPDTVEAVAPGADLPLTSAIPQIVAPGLGGGGGGGGSGGGGGGGGGGDPTNTPTLPPVVGTVPTEVGAVPEPSTWVLLLFGFGAIGVSLRRANASGMSSRQAGRCARD